MKFDTKKCQEFSEKVVVAVSGEKYTNQIKKLVEEYPEECEVIEVNKTVGKDESIRVRIPMAWIEIDPEETDK